MARSQFSVQFTCLSGGDMKKRPQRAFAWFLVGVALLALSPLVPSTWRLAPIVVGMCLVSIDLSSSMSRLGITLIALAAVVWIVLLRLNPPDAVSSAASAIVVTSIVAVVAALPQIIALKRSAKRGVSDFEDDND